MAKKSTTTRSPAARAAAAAAAIGSVDNEAPVTRLAGVTSTPNQDSAFKTMLGKIPENGYITVGCKLPNGLKLRIFNMVPFSEPIMGGGWRETMIAQDTGEEVRLYGYAVPPNLRPKYLIIGDYALTPNVPAAFFRTWLEQNKESDLVKRGLVFAHKDGAQAQDMAEERKDLKSGFEPLEQGFDPRIGKPATKNLTPIATEEQTAKRLERGEFEPAA